MKARRTYAVERCLRAGSLAAVLLGNAFTLLQFCPKFDSVHEGRPRDIELRNAGLRVLGNGVFLTRQIFAKHINCVSTVKWSPTDLAVQDAIRGLSKTIVYGVVKFGHVREVQRHPKLAD